MSGAKFTPGPWRYAPTGTVMERYGQPFGIAGDNSTQLVAGAFGDVVGGREQAEANARLIAAAPDLLVAAQTVLADLNARIDAARGGPVPLFRGIAELHAAIAKATGAAS